MLKQLPIYSPEEFESQKHPFSIKRLSTTIGAELHDIDLKKDLSQEEKDHIYNALLTYKVIFFRDQDISTEQHMRFGQYFGELEIHPFAPLGTNREDHPEVLRITHNEDNKPKENAWHSDVTWRMEPSLGSILRMVETHPVGGDTLFANMEAAYENLPDEIKEKLEGAFAIHDFALFRNRLIKQGKSP